MKPIHSNNLFNDFKGIKASNYSEFNDEVVRLEGLNFEQSSINPRSSIQGDIHLLSDPFKPEPKIQGSNSAVYVFKFIV
jgi:hypothetical protein